MDTVAESTRSLLERSLPEGGFVVGGGRAQFMEVVDTNTGSVWMSAAPATLAQFKSLQLGDSLMPMGIGFASMDCAGFRHSPDGEGEPVRQRVIDGVTFINVATPGKPAPTVPDGGPLRIEVNKGQTIGFDAGRDVVLMECDEGTFVELVGDDKGDSERVLPAGATLRTIRLESPWIVPLPTPTITYFWMEKNLRSFQGPVTPPV